MSVSIPAFGGGEETTLTPPRESPGKGIVHHADLIQGSEEWLAARCGLLTASEMKLIITPTLKIASNDKERAHLWELLAQRITRFVEPSYISDDMLRGQEDEIEARLLYDRHIARVEEVGFITSDKWGFTLGYSPDGLIGNNGLLECKSRRQRLQVEHIVDRVPVDAIDPDHILQAQTGFLVSERGWMDHVSYSGGLHMTIVRVHPDAVVQAAIIEAAGKFEEKLAVKLARYHEVLASKARLIPTERRVEQEITL